MCVLPHHGRTRVGWLSEQLLPGIGGWLGIDGAILTILGPQKDHFTRPSLKLAIGVFNP